MVAERICVAIHRNLYPIYDLILEMMVLYGLALAKHEDEWRFVMCDDE
jgi:hypothetical protein